MRSQQVFLASAALVVCAIAADAERLNPVHWQLAVEPPTASPGSTVAARLTARMDGDWHIYSLSTPPGGPKRTTISLADNPAVRGYRIFQPKPDRKFDPNFNIDAETFGKEVVFVFEIQLSPDAKPGPVELTANAAYQSCTENQCLPLRKVSVSTVLRVESGAKGKSVALPSEYNEFKGPPGASAAGRQPGARQASAGAATVSEGLGAFLAVAFGFGVAAIFTPCVFPMIPITLSFFLNKEGASRGEILRQALLFCLGIIFLFTAIGFTITLVLGPFGVVQLGSNPWVNAFIAIVFLVFGLSLLGAFEITLPSGLLTRLNDASNRGGSIGTLLMGLTFSLTSFACVGPFIGTLLAASVQGGKLQPLLGMATFATGLAAPFFLLALFPSYLKRLPRSGGWMVRVKVVLGFVVLAAMLKYLSSVDQVLQWNVLTRERFLAVWFVLFALAGLYLLGLLPMEGIKRDEPVGVGRLLVAVALLAFSFSLLPGMFGAKLGELDAYVPLGTAAPGGGAAQESGLAWMKNNYDAALARAKSENKVLLVSFTGYACTNCHWMKANMFTRPEVAAALKNMVLVELYTDGTDPESERNQKLQESRFGTVAIPFYAILDANDSVINTFPGATRQEPEFLAFLNTKTSGQTAPQSGL